MVLGHPDVVEDRAQLFVEPGGLVVVVRRVRQVDVAVGIDGHPVVRIGEILGGQPEVDGVGGHVVEAPCGASIVSLGSSPFMA